MYVRDMVKDYLEKNGYDGLFNDCMCGCHVDDLIPCCGACDLCEPGYECEPPKGVDDATFWIGPKENNSNWKAKED